MAKFLRNMWVIGLIALLTTACKENKLDLFEPIDSTNRIISADGALTDQMFRDEELVMIPIKIKLSGPATKAFQVGIEAIPDTINKLIDNNTLENTVLMPSSYLDYPNVINVAYGTDTATVYIGFKITGIEKYFTKKVAAAFRLTSPEKGNSINPVNKTFVVVIDTEEATTLEEIHYLSVVNRPGEVFEIPRGNEYQITSSGITIPLGINLGGVAGKPFSVTVVNDVDTIDYLIANDQRFKNAIKLPDFDIDTLIRFKTSSNNADLSISIPWNVFDANITARKKFAIALKLDKPSRHLLHPENNFVILLLDPTINLDNNSFIRGNGDGLNAQYFTKTQFLGYADEQTSLNPPPGAVPDPPFIERVDVDINWGPNGRAFLPSLPGMSGDNFSVRWFGWFLAPLNGYYTFYQTIWDDGSRLFIDGVPIINDFNTEFNQPHRKATIYLNRGDVYKIEAHHRDNVGGQQVNLQYEVKDPDGFVLNKLQTVPQSQLFSTAP